MKSILISCAALLSATAAVAAPNPIFMDVVSCTEGASQYRVFVDVSNLSDTVKNQRTTGAILFSRPGESLLVNDVEVTVNVKGDSNQVSAEFEVPGTVLVLSMNLKTKKGTISAGGSQKPLKCATPLK